MLSQIGDGELQSLEAMFKAGTQALVVVYQGYKQVKGIKDEVLRKKEQAKLSQLLLEYTQKYPFMFKGDVTDLSYFLNRSALPIEDINKLDPALRETVKKNLNELIHQGFLQISPAGREIILTNNGKEFIKKPEFLERVTKSNIEANELIEKGIGQEQENRRFVPNQNGQINYEDGLVNNEAEIIAENVKKAKSNAAMTVTKKGVVYKPLPDQQEALKFVKYKRFKKKARLTKKALKEVTVKNVKTAAQTTGKIATQTATVAGKTAEGAAKATGVASGAATAGIGTAATVGYEVLTGGFKVVSGLVRKIGEK